MSLERIDGPAWTYLVGWRQWLQMKCQIDLEAEEVARTERSAFPKCTGRKPEDTYFHLV